MITSPRNRRVAKAVRLKKRAMREKDRRFLVEGVQGVLEALRSGRRVTEVFHTALPQKTIARVGEAGGRAGVAVELVSDEVMSHLTSTVTPQGIVAAAEFLDESLESIPESGVVPVLVEVRDPGNAGTILRSADASGAAAVVFTSSSVDIYNPKTVRASAGSLFHLPVVRDAALPDVIAVLRERGFGVLAAAPNGERSIHDADLSGSTAVLLGNEAHGLASEAVALADGTISVPIEGGAESLNLAAAAAVILFEAARQRARGGGLAQIVAGSAHDLRSPLTAVRGFASTLVSKWDRLSDEQRLTMLEGIVQDASRMGAIVTALVDAARIESGRLRLAAVPTDLWEAVRATAHDISGWGNAEVSVEAGGEAGSASARGPISAVVDPARLRTMLFALVDAAAWWGETGPVRIAIGADPDPFVEVRREGSSLDAPTASMLFLPREPGSGGGTKVGLFVARALAEAHGGRIDVEAGDAVRFRLSLPQPDRPR